MVKLPQVKYILKIQTEAGRLVEIPAFLFTYPYFIINHLHPFYLFRKGTFTGAHVQTAYFRKRIQIADASLFTALHLNVWRDDGAIVYLNGVEIFRSNMPVGSVAHDSPALYEILSQRLAGKRVENGVLQTGENWLAVETAEDLRKLVIGWGIPDWLLDGDLAFLTEEELNSLNVQVNIRLDQ